MFIISRRVIKSNILAKYTLVKIDVHERYIRVLQMNLKPAYLNRYPGFKYFQKLNKCQHKIQFPEEITTKELTLKEHENIGNLKLDPK